MIMYSEFKDTSHERDTGVSAYVVLYYILCSLSLGFYAAHISSIGFNSQVIWRKAKNSYIFGFCVLVNTQNPSLSIKQFSMRFYYL